MESILSSGVINYMMRCSPDQLPEKPILQLLERKAVPKTAGSELRFRLHLNDGIWSYSSSLLATQLNHTLDSVPNNSIIRLNKYNLNDVPNAVPKKKLILVVDFEVLKRGDEIDQIGNPEPWSMEKSQPPPPGPFTTKVTAGMPSKSFVPPQHSIQHQKVSNNSSGVTSMPQQHNFYQQKVGNASTSVAMSSGKSSASVSHTPTLNGHPFGQMINPISSLTPYQHKWCIKARVITKPPIREYSNSKGQGKLFSVEFADQSGEIRATGFNQDCDRFYNLLQPNCVYFVSKGQIKPANRQFSSLNNDYELTFSSETEISPCHDQDNYQLPTVKYNLVRINDLVNVSKERLVDVIGVIINVSELQQVLSKKTGQTLHKRDLTIVDESSASVVITIWGDEAEKFPQDSHAIIAFRGIRIQEFKGACQLSTVGNSTMQLNPDLPEAHRLRGWYDSESQQLHITNISATNRDDSVAAIASKFTLIGLARAEGLGAGDHPEYYTVKATVVQVKKDNCMYQACPNDQCNKKLVDQHDGSYRCEKCSQTFYNFKWRLMLNIQISDLSDSTWVTCFQETAEQILGVTADDLGNMKEADDEGYQRVFNKVVFKTFAFRVKAKTEIFNDEKRVRTSCVNVSPVDYSKYCVFLEEKISEAEMML